jgi:two-component system, chemotaxis family, response regulator PixH
VPPPNDRCQTRQPVCCDSIYGGCHAGVLREGGDPQERHDDDPRGVSNRSKPDVSPHGSPDRTDASPQEAVSVLIVDHDADTRAMYAEYLRSLAYQVEEADDGRVALAKALSYRPTVIVTETRLPGLSGFEFCRMLRRDEATQRTPVVVVTAVAFATDKELAQAAGADIVLAKPCLPDDLEKEIRRLVSVARPEDPSAAAAGENTGPFARSSSPGRRLTMNRRHQRRETLMPPVAPPILRCNSCGRSLVYLKSQIGGVNARQSEQWDYFRCPSGCGGFQYRHRSRRLRRNS